MFKRAPVSSPIPNRSSSNRNASIKPWRCFAPPTRRSDLPARPGDTNNRQANRQELYGERLSFFGQASDALDDSNLLPTARQISPAGNRMGKSMCEICQNALRDKGINKHPRPAIAPSKMGYFA